MKSASFCRVALPLLIFLFIDPAWQAQPASQAQAQRAKSGPATSQNGDTFQINHILDSPGNFSLVITDGQERVITSRFSLEQLKAARAVFEEAKTFAFTEEAVGAERPVTTRFSSRGAPGFFVDVTKFGDQSQFHITLSSELGSMTVEAGNVRRKGGREAGFFFEVLAQIAAYAK